MRGTSRTRGTKDMSTTAETAAPRAASRRGAAAGTGIRLVPAAWRGPAAMAVMGAAMLDTMLPGAHLLPAMLWVVLELGLAMAVAVPGRGARCCTPLAAHRALGLIVMAALTLAMAGMRAMGDVGGGRSSAATVMTGMHHGIGLSPLALAAAAGYCAWSLWRARRHGGRLEMLTAAASVALMAVFVA
jgi:hypothetical protein